MSNIYKQSLNRKQQQFSPPSLDEYVDQNNQVRAIEDYVELLDMVELGLMLKLIIKSKIDIPIINSILYFSIIFIITCLVSF